MNIEIKNFIQNYYFLLTGILIFFSFPTYDIWFLKGYAFFAWFSLVPLFVYIRGKKYKDVIISSFVAGFIGIFSVYNWIGNFGSGVEGGYIFLVALLMPTLTILFTTKILAAEFLSRKFEKLRIFIFPCVWLFFDWLQSIGFLAFPWTYWGYSQFNFTSLIQISAFTGVMGVSFLLIAVNSAIGIILYENFSKENFSKKNIINSRGIKSLAIILIIIILCIIYGFITTHIKNIKEKKNLRLSVVQTCISPWESWRQNRFLYLDYLKRYSKDSLKYDPDMIIWSESATLENISFHYENGNLNEFEYSVLDFVRETNTPIITGEIGIVENFFEQRYYPQNNAVYINSDGSVAGSYAKINLVPFGEWFPYEKWSGLVKKIRSQFEHASSFIPGDRPKVFELNGNKFGILICYEGIFYRLCREYRNMGAEFFVNITNYGWTDTYAGHIQPYSAAVFRAVENGIWYVSAGNTGLTALIDPFGRTTSSIPALKRGYLIADLDINQNRNTLYSKYGDLFLYICILFVICILASYIINTIFRAKIYSLKNK